MMRSLFSAVSGLKTHQTKMDVIGNNVSNVNTTAFKSSNVVFSDIMYQTTAAATAANAATGKGGVNAKQIGLGVTTGATKITITNPGSAQTTGDPFDIRLTDKVSTNFFIVNDGMRNVFTRSGSFFIDGAGNLAMTSTGYTVMGWQVDPATGNIKKDTVSALRVMQEKNLTSPPESTTAATIGGIIDKNDTNVTSDEGQTLNLNFFDRLGYQYVAQFSLKLTDAESQSYTIELSDILDSENKSVLSEYIEGGGDLAAVFGRNTTAKKTYPIAQEGIKYMTDGDFNLGYQGEGYYFSYSTFDTAGNPLTEYVQVTVDPTSNTYTIPEYSYYADAQSGMDQTGAITVPEKIGSVTDLFGITQAQLNSIGSTTVPTGSFNTTTGAFEYTTPAVNFTLKIDPSNGEFSYVGMQGSDRVTLNLANTLGNEFTDIEIDFSTCLSSDNGGKSTIAAEGGFENGTVGKGKALGVLIGLSVSNDGKIFGAYDNGNTALLGQIAVAQFANASGLEKIGENCYGTTLNSGEFDGIGVEIAADGSSMTSGELEMSNVDLSTEFTQMIITQRGFQSNSRIITVSDTLLEELINLKR